jgi:AraC-like DNA-binding protein
LALFRRYFPIADESASMKVARDPDGVSVAIDLVGVPRHLVRQRSEFRIAMLVKAMRMASGRDVRPVRVQFAHVRSSGLQEFSRFFGCPVEFSAPCDQVLFSNGTLALPLVTADPQLLLTLRPICEAAAAALNATAGSLRASVESEVQRLLPQGQANLETVAKALAVSKRTLARNLAAESTTFSDVVDQLRCALALRYLEEPSLTLAQIAWRLGYQEPTSFTHAFTRWTGRSPSAARKGPGPEQRAYGNPDAKSASREASGSDVSEARAFLPPTAMPKTALHRVAGAPAFSGLMEEIASTAKLSRSLLNAVRGIG